jgi:hypothetical protein
MSGAFQHMVTLLSFVLALGVSHQLFTVVEMVRAGSRVRWSWVHALWMLNSFLQVIAWWFGIWDFHNIQEWPILSVLLNLAAVLCVFLAIAFVCPRIPESGSIDLREFHKVHGKKYIGFTIGQIVLAIGEALYYGNVYNVPGQNLQAAIIGFIGLAALVALFVSRPMVQRIAVVAIVAASVVFLFVGDPVLRSN